MREFLWQRMLKFLNSRIGDALRGQGGFQLFYCQKKKERNYVFLKGIWEDDQRNSVCPDEKRSLNGRHLHFHRNYLTRLFFTEFLLPLSVRIVRRGRFARHILTFGEVGTHPIEVTLTIYGMTDEWGFRINHDFRKVLLAITTTSATLVMWISKCRRRARDFRIFYWRWSLTLVTFWPAQNLVSLKALG